MMRRIQVLCSLKVLLIILLLSAFSCSDPGETCIDTNCADYASQAEAQADFNANPECRNDLDGDNDGEACEDHFRNSGGGTGSGGTSCPTTANCGCSNKRKAECPSACCKWVVGDGCKCK